MTNKKLIGWIMIGTFVALLFGGAVLVMGLLNALILWGSAGTLAFLFIYGIKLIYEN